MTGETPDPTAQDQARQALTPDHLPAPTPGRLDWVVFDNNSGQSPNTDPQPPVQPAQGQIPEYVVRALNSPSSPKLVDERQPTPTPEKPKRRVAILALGATAFVAAAGYFAGAFGGSGTDSSAHLRDRATIEAPPAPDTSTSTTIAEQVTIPAIATTAPIPKATTTTEPKPKTTTSTTQEAINPEKVLLEADIAAIKATGFENILKGHSLEVSRFDSATGHNILVSVDGAKLTQEQIKNFKTQVEAAETIAASKSSFTSHLKLGPNTERDVTYDVGPAPVDTHLFFFYNGDITQLKLPLNDKGQPEDVSKFPNEFTKVSSSNRAAATMVKMQPEGLTVGGFRAFEHYSGVGIMQSYVSEKATQASKDSLAKDLKNGEDISYLANLAPQYDPYKLLDLVGAELGNNGFQSWYEYARAGKPPFSMANPVSYSVASRFITAMKLESGYQNLEAYYPEMPQELFNKLRAA